MIMLDVLAQNMMQRTFTKQNHPCQRFVFYRFHPSFREGIQPRRAWRQRKTFDVSVVENLTERITILAITVVEKVLTRLKEAPLLHRRVASYLHHPLFLGMSRDPGDAHFTGVEFDEEQDVERHEAAECPDLCGEEIRGP